MSAALTTLGHPEYAPEGSSPDARVYAFGPVTQHTVAGRAVVFALIRTAEGVSLTPPPGIFTEGGIIGEAATGIFMTIPRTIPIRQFLLGLALDGIITREEALAAASTGAVPSFIAAVFAALPEDDAFAAELTWRAMIEVDRDNPLLTLLASQIGMTPVQMDSAFLRWASL